ncbi:MAG: ATP-dependent DNA helicase RecG [Anaerovoracaceae bacterium]
MKLYDSVNCIKGIGPKKSDSLRKLKINTVEDMLFFFPRDYEDRRRITKIGDIDEASQVLIKAEITLIINNGYKYGRKQQLKLLVTDDTGSLEVVFFNAGYLQGKFKAGEVFLFYGKVDFNFGRAQMRHPEFYDDKESNDSSGILPVYPLSRGITQKDMRNWQRQIKDMSRDIEDFLPHEIVSKNRLCSIEYAIENVHFPEEKQKLLEAKYRLIFDELIVLQTGLFAVRENIKKGKNGIAFSKEAKIKPYIDSMEYSLTRAQIRCVKEIETDLESSKVMNRLVQGDVGSGKTAVAEIAMYKAVCSGYQAVLMAPTEILARQHFEGLKERFGVHKIKVGFLSGSVPISEKRSTLKALKTGEIQILIGTHAVIQPDVEFLNLGLAITDEQHRFGVNQRIKLKEKGSNPNILVMTATPIPRTLAVILYGDLDISVIDEMPPGRQKTETKNFTQENREKCYREVENQINMGRQAYVVAPLIDDSDNMDLKSAHKIHNELQSRFKKHKVALLHGSMKQDEKDNIMKSFYEGNIDVLVATVVIEVGINVPNASVMVIENAERFGLAQLHQLRGRVGRGGYKSYCFLITEGSSEIAKKRAEIMESSSDGFYIAEEDLKLRGPGEIFGTRQHGIPNLNISDLSKHADVLNNAKEEAKNILKKDPNLENPENQPLKRRIVKFFGDDFMLNM